ncbi:extracellular solute-binding protein [Variovorax sp. NFACC27]|uniref:extracellular solute-binding protein n=1 Tax=unclassified Variovorax TaxID=663243 RepID=UPI00089D3014|nr:sn-glycerol 3-phosphate transport system substrate-binding protein [Variovorax sp. NFACC28]SEG60641.1 sn-glycerol 3-phosphate transport system substrate-binding protein [Variovorax sp. NFACC29]SFC60240.1 sn-glycerol 3-phosphate transport system substrate-binding protein [Variovorax sp. NFACC26]SFG67521.1 sn-glycerol 3-phosphate transport system substrate-binding protein [Variovorax sp. NFACC27]
MNFQRRSTLATLAMSSMLWLGVNTPAAAEPVQIQWWHAMGGTLGERVDELVKNFNASQQKYVVVAVNKGNYDEVINGTIAAYRAKRAPQLVQIYERGFMTMLLSDATMPVQDLLDQRGYKVDWADFVKPVAGFYSYKGKLMTMPFNSSSPILWYNKTHFEKAGFARPAETWQELEKQLYTIKQKGISACGSVLAGDYHWSLLENYSAINDLPYATKANGYQGLDTEFVYNKTSVVSQVGRIKKWIDDGVMQIAGQGLSPEQLFTSGKCSTFFASTAAHSGIEREAKIDWSATYLPWEEGKQPKNSTIGGASLWVMKGQKPAEYDAVAAFLDYLAKPETQVWWHKSTGYVPLSNKAYQLAKSQDYYKQHPTREIAILQLTRGTPTANSTGFHFGNFTQTMMAQRDEFENVVAGKKTPQAGMDDAVKRGNEILRQYEKLNKGRY